MNREMVLRVADAIEGATRRDANPSIGFNMSGFYDRRAEEGDDFTGHACGTTACIAGWAVHVNGGDLESLNRNHAVSIEAGDLLGLDDIQAYALFYAPDLADDVFARVKPSQAVTVLRHLAETGVIDWSVAEGVS